MCLKPVHRLVNCICRSSLLPDRNDPSGIRCLLSSLLRYFGESFRRKRHRYREHWSMQLIKNLDFSMYRLRLGLAAGTSVMGLLGGLLWWFVWWFWGIPALSVLPVVFMLGFLMSSLLFYLPISFEFLTNDFNFWSAFFCCWLVLPVIFVTFTRLVSCHLLSP